MACFDGMTSAEIAITIGEPVANVKDSINSAVKKIATA